MVVDRNVVNVYWNLYWCVVKNQRCGASLGECKAAWYQVTNYTILVYTSSVSLLREKMSRTGYIKNCLLLWCKVFNIIKYVVNEGTKEVMDCCSKKWKMMEICFKLMKVVRRNAVSYCLKDFILTVRFLDSRSRVVRHPGHWDFILCKVTYKFPTFWKTVICSRLRETCTSGQGVIS